jgi:hypothetical protein
MATNKSKLTQAEKQLDARLDALQYSCGQWVRMHHVTQQQERENLAEIYYWWQEAYKIPAYYNAKLAYLPPEQRRNTTEKFNFGPVLRLFYGVNTLDDSKRSRMSSALNAIHDEWQAKPKLYKKDIAKLANYIDQNKGVTGLAMQQAKISPLATPSEDIKTEVALAKREAEQAAIAAAVTKDAADEAASRLAFLEERRRRGRPEHVDVTDAHRREALLDEAQDYWRKANGIASFDLDFGIEANKRKYALALVRVDDDQLTVINSSIDEEVIKSALLSSYRKQFASVPRNLRPVLEMLRTQYIGGKMATQLAKVPDLAIDAKGKKVEVHKRLIFIPSANQILLSQTCGESGLVTAATLSFQLLNVVDCDFYLGGTFTYLQRRLLANDDCNQFHVTNVSRVMAMHEAPSIVYAMKLTNKLMPADFVHVDIVSFGSSDFDSQLTINDKYVSAIKSKFKVNPGVLQKLAMQFADKWIESKGDHANRPENDLCNFSVTADAFEFEIFDKTGNVGSNPSCNHGKKLKLDKPYKQCFKCRDLMVALSGIGALQLIGDVEILLDSNVFVIKYKTDVANYTTAIPSYSKKTVKRNSKAFAKYKPKLYLSHDAAVKHLQPLDDDALTPLYCYA